MAAAGGFRLRMAMAVIMGMVMLVVMSVLVLVVGVIVARMIVAGVIMTGMIVVGAVRRVIVPCLVPRVSAACAAGVFLLGGQGL
ncbi:MAG: hypothetical protein ACN6PE_06695 [Achromobacter marplatensis]|uniref:hypothetical protein n=1 Tax=Achromobacter marplatensis TaxID=470868 RepID=UPI003D06DCD5